jgi:hypothetical protein
MMTEHFTIEITAESTHCDDGSYYAETIVIGPASFDGEIHPAIVKHAELLRSIIGSGACYRIGSHRPVVIDSDGVKTSAHTVWLTGEVYPTFRQIMAEIK